MKFAIALFMAVTLMLTGCEAVESTPEATTRRVETCQALGSDDIPECVLALKCSEKAYTCDDIAEFLEASGGH